MALSDLAPILGVVLGPMLLFAVALMRYQHLDSTKTRDLIEESNKENRDLIEESNKENRDLTEESNKENRRLIEESNKENRRLIEKNRDLIEESSRENRRLIEATHDLIRANHAEVSGSLADARERLARIEGHLRIVPPPRQDASDGDTKAA